eukprot:gene31210-40179_t
MTEEDREVNEFGPALLFIHCQHTLCAPLLRYLAEASSVHAAMDEGALGEVRERKGTVGTADGSSTPTSVVAASSTTSTPTSIRLILNRENGNGLFGSILPSPAKRTALLGATINAPEEPRGAFHPLIGNGVLCATYSLPADSTHLSRILPGTVLAASALDEHDLLPRRPPRLNKGFNLYDISTQHGDRTKRDGLGVGSGSGYPPSPFGGHNSTPNFNYHNTGAPRGYHPGGHPSQMHSNFRDGGVGGRGHPSHIRFGDVPPPLGFPNGGYAGNNGVVFPSTGLQLPPFQRMISAALGGRPPAPADLRLAHPSYGHPAPPPIYNAFESPSIWSGGGY